MLTAIELTKSSYTFMWVISTNVTETVWDIIISLTVDLGCMENRGGVVGSNLIPSWVVENGGCRLPAAAPTNLLNSSGSCPDQPNTPTERKLHNLRRIFLNFKATATHNSAS